MMSHEQPEEDHLEIAKRIQVIYGRLIKEEFFNRSSVLRIKSRKVSENELLLCHDKSYIDEINDIVKNSKPFPGDDYGDMYSVPESIDAIYYSAGCAAQLADEFLAGNINRGIAIVRPPGHHAHHNKAAGFCFFNNAAIAAIKLANAGKKVLIVDYDCHMGDGTLDILKQPRENNDLIRLYSIHRYDNGTFYPGGIVGRSTRPKVDERITLVGFNLKDGPKKDDDYYISQFKARFDRRTFKWAPDVIVVSAGFDAAIHDRGDCQITEEGYKEITKIIYKFCPNVLMILEGGYNLRELAKCSFATIDTLERIGRNK